MGNTSIKCFFSTMNLWDSFIKIPQEEGFKTFKFQRPLKKLGLLWRAAPASL